MFSGCRFWPGRYLLYRERIPGFPTYWTGAFDQLGFAIESADSNEGKGFCSARHAYRFAGDHAPHLNDFRARRMRPQSAPARTWLTELTV
jgi:hypothetical protein